MKKKVITSAILTIALALSLLLGATYALFTSESKTNIAISSGKLDVVATVEEATMSSSLGAALGKAEVDGNEVVLSGFVPGDKATFTIEIENKSDISALYRTMVKVEDDNGLFDGLVVEIGGQTFNGFTAVSEWKAVSFAKNVVQVSIELPVGKGNEYQGKSAKLVYIVEAVQSNAGMTDADVNDVEIYTAFDLIHLSRLVNEQNKNQAGKTVKLMNDIDMKNRELVAIGSLRNASAEFAGTFDGQGYAIKNVNIVSFDDYGTGLFGSTGGQTTTVIRNFTMDGGTVTGPKNVAAVLGMGYKTTVENVVVKNITVNQTGEKRASALIANAVDLVTVRNNRAENVTVIGTVDVAELISHRGTNLVEENNTAVNVQLFTSLNFEVSTDAELEAALSNDAEYIKVIMTKDLVISGSRAKALGTLRTKSILIEGSGYLLTNSSTYQAIFKTVNPDATLTIKNMSMNGTRATGTWDIYNLEFQSEVTLENVDLLRSTTISSDALLKNVSITEDKNYYGLWITADGQTIEIDGLEMNVASGRGIAIKDEYIDEVDRKSVTLKVKNAEFITNEKAAILVTSTAGAEISLENVDISKVTADTTNHVWVDDARKDSYNFVLVTGGSKKQE